MKYILDEKLEKDFPAENHLCSFCHSDRIRELELPELDKASMALFKKKYTAIEKSADMRDAARRAVSDAISKKEFSLPYDSLPKDENGGDLSDERLRVRTYFGEKAKEALKKSDSAWIRYSTTFRETFINLKNSKGAQFANYNERRFWFECCDRHWQTLRGKEGNPTLYESVFNHVKKQKDFTYKDFEAAGIPKQVVDFMLSKAEKK